MNANELAGVMEKYSVAGFQYPLCDEFKQSATMLRQQQEKLNKYELRHAEQRKRIDELEAYQKHDVELAEAAGWDKGYEAGRQLGMKQERAMWNLSASTQEIMDTHPVKELTDEEIVAVWDNDCVVLDEDKLVIRFARAILRKASEK